MPLIAADVERIAATSFSCRKAILLSQILCALARAFFLGVCMTNLLKRIGGALTSDETRANI